MNKFKTTILSLAGLAMGASLTGCAESFLDVESKTESTTGNYYKTESDAYRALLGCYDGWRRTQSSGGVTFPLASLLMSDETFGGGGTGDARNYQIIDRFDMSQAPSYVDLYIDDWKRYYEAIYRCNELINKEEQIEWKEGSGNRGLFMGEARTIRAICYFDLVRLFGNIPLLLEASQENLPQSPAADVYKAIFDDLKYAIENIPADAYPKAQAAVNDGHVTKFAAEALLARAYLFYSGYYGQEPEGVTKQDALDACEDVIANSGCALVEDFKTLWAASSLVPMPDGSKGWDPTSTYAGEANSEVVLQMKFTPSQDYNGNDDSNRWQVNPGMRGMVHAPYGKGWGLFTATPHYVEKFPTGDLRREASVIDFEAEGISSDDDYETALKDWREFTGYVMKKYSPIAFADETPGSRPDGSGDFMINNTQPYVIVRLADVYLMAAELGSANASKYLNTIRERAGYTDVVAPTQENIMKERALEFAFEGLRYWDLLRTGVNNAAREIAASSGKVISGNADDYVTILENNIIETKGLSQIPNTQITLSNGVLKQNAGW